MNNSQAVIDANIAIYTLIPTGQTRTALNLLETLRVKRIALFAPRLWLYEVTAGIHKYRYAGVIEQDEAEEAILAAYDLNINFIEETPALSLSASRWGMRLKQMTPYDGFYLAAAEQLHAPFWTADKRLANHAGPLGVTWIRWMGDVK